MRVDVLVIGGGPAGSATALALQAMGVQALVLERTRYDAGRPGDTITGSGLALLEGFGLGAHVLGQGAIPVSEVLSRWGDDVLRPRAAVFEPYGKGWHLDRRAFDALLARAAEEAGALVFCDARVTAATRARGVWRVGLRGPDGAGEVRARVLVDASGRAAWLARTRGSRRRRIDRLVALTTVVSRATDRALVIEADRNGWWYSSPLPCDRLLVAYMTDADLAPDPARTFSSQLAAASATRARLGTTTDVVVTASAAGTYALEPPGGPGWIAVGDAAWGLDPLSGTGIHRALESGVRGAEAIARALGGDRRALGAFARASMDRFAAALELRARFYALERRWATAPFWRRRQAHGASSEP